MELKYKVEYFSGTGKIHKSYWYYEKKINESIVEVIHSTNGSALVSYYIDGSLRSEEWFIDGQRHRINGPAIIEYKDSEQVKRFYFIRDSASPCLKKWLVENELYEVPVEKWTSVNMAMFTMAF